MQLHPAAPGKPALLTHDEVTTLFRLATACTMLTRIEHAGVSGINGVAWDAVELPSQFMENWCWGAGRPGAYFGHYETGAALPQDLLDKMLAAKKLPVGHDDGAPTGFSLFDFELHASHGDGRNVLQVSEGVRDEVSGHAPAGVQPFPLCAHLCRRLRSGLLQLQVG